MANSTNRGYPLPNPDAVSAKADVQSTSDAIEAIDGEVHQLFTDVALAATQSGIDAAIAALKTELQGGAALTLDQFNELADAINNDPDFYTTIMAVVAGKSDSDHNHNASYATIAALNLKLNATSYTAADVLTKIKTVDGSGTGLDADLLDGDEAAAFVKLAIEDQVVTGGFRVTSLDDGTQTTGTYTPDPGDRPLISITNGGAFTFADPAYDGAFAMLVTNNASAGTITFSGFDMQTGSDLSTTDTEKFMLYITRVASSTHLHIEALQ